MEHGERIARLEAEMDSFDRWQEKQNGRLDILDDKLSSIQHWLIGLMGTAIISLILVIVQLLT